MIDTFRNTAPDIHQKISDTVEFGKMFILVSHTGKVLLLIAFFSGYPICSSILTRVTTQNLKLIGVLKKLLVNKLQLLKSLMLVNRKSKQL